MKFADVVGLLVAYRAEGHPVPSGMLVQARLLAKTDGRVVPGGGPNLDRPDWAKSSHGAKSLFLELGGEVTGTVVHDDSRGWGTDIEVYCAPNAVPLDATFGNEGPMMPFREYRTSSTTFATPGGNVRLISDHAGGFIAHVTVNLDRSSTVLDLQRYSPTARETVERARACEGECSILHLFAALLEHAPVQAYLRAQNRNVRGMLAALREETPRLPKPSPPSTTSAPFMLTLARAELRANGAPVSIGALLDAALHHEGTRPEEIAWKRVLGV